MSLPDEDIPPASFIRDEAISRLSQTLVQIVDQFPPTVRLRMLAFVHLIENAETLKASLEVEPAGHLRLILDTHVTPARGHQH